MHRSATSPASARPRTNCSAAPRRTTGEDQQDFLQKWKELGIKAIAPTYPTYQWRAPIIAALRVLDGEPVPGPECNLPQPAITAENLDQYINEKMPPLHYAMCGCENMPGYPERWDGQ